MRRMSFFIPESLDAGLKALKQRDGVAEAESIRRALIIYLKDKLHGSKVTGLERLVKETRKTRKGRKT